MQYEFLQRFQDGPIARVVLNRPDQLNALNPQIMRELEQVARSFLDEDETRVVIFSGAGKHFSAGADLKAPQVEMSLLQKRRASGLGARMIRAITEIPQVTIAAIQGVALGGGACIPTACDFRIGTEDCFCGYPEVNLGINLMWQSLPLCVRLIGPARAKRMIMLGNKEDAETLLAWGWLDEVVKPENLEAAATEMATVYAGQPPIPTQMIKQSINAVSGALDQAVMHMDTDQNMLTTMTSDRTEGITAFFERREPTFTGN